MPARREQPAPIATDEQFRLFVESVRDYAIFMLDSDGHVASWNAGAQRIKGYAAAEILGRHFSAFYPAAAVEAGHPQRALEIAAREGRFEEEAERLRKDGSRFWAHVVITAVRDATGGLVGFGKVTRDITERRQIARQVRRRGDELAAANAELEGFLYAVSHDLRAPLRAIDGFSAMVLESAAAKLDDSERDELGRVRAAAQRMARLLEDILQLSRLSRTRLDVLPLDLTAMVRSLADELHRAEPERRVELHVEPGLIARGDPRLVRTALEHLLRNAWKFSRRRDPAHVEVGRTEREGEPAFFVRDDGAGFDMRFADKLFLPFQRLHGSGDFEGSGIGLATVRHVMRRHGGDAWAEGEPERGATFYFRLGEPVS